MRRTDYKERIEFVIMRLNQTTDALKVDDLEVAFNNVSSALLMLQGIQKDLSNPSKVEREMNGGDG